MKVHIHTFGCKVNTYDSGLLEKNLVRAGFGLSGANEGLPQVHILNTCAVTAEATQQAVREIRKIKSRNPLAKLVVTGCAAQVDTGSFDQLPSVDLVIANSHKGLLPELLNKHLKGELKERVFKSNIFKKDDLEAGGGLEESHSRSFLKIQDGCNSFCSYCIIPYARGKSRSIPIKELVQRVNAIAAEGIREVVLTGVHIADYEDPETQEGLPQLIQALLGKTSIQRFRLSSLEPVELTDEILSFYSDPRMCPHFHMSIQSASDSVLKGMKRRYTRAQVLDAFERIQKKVPGAFVGMDVIVGFPGETDEHFQETYSALAESDWSRIHVFPYSERSGTKATILPDSVPWEVRKRRASQLRQLSLDRFQSKARLQVGQLKLSLPLSKGRNQSVLSRDYWNILVEGQAPQNSQGEAWVQISEFLEAGMVGRPEGILKGVYASP